LQDDLPSGSEVWFGGFANNHRYLLLVQRATIRIAQLNIVIAGSKRELLGICDLIRTNNWPTLLCNSRAIRRLSSSWWETETCHFISPAKLFFELNKRD